MQKYLPKHLTNKTIVLPSLSSKKINKDWRGKPVSWPDIRKNAQDGHIYLLVDTRYPIGFTATAIGGYSVKIDGVAYDNYNNQEQFSMADWSEYSATEGYAINYPTGATKAHTIDIFPQTESENITAFKCARVASSGQEVQGILWEHFNLTNSVDISDLNANGSFGSSDYSNPSLIACTAKNNELNFTGIQRVFFRCEKLTYVPVLNCTYTSWLNASNMFANCYLLENITIKNLIIGDGSYSFHNCRKLEKVSGNIDYSQASLLRYHYSNNNSLKDITLDLSSSNSLKVVGCLGSSSYFMSGFKGLRVSSSAPFDYATAPQINVSYTGMDRAALVQLFNDLPSVSDGQIINITGSTGSEDLTSDDKAIATNKGWSITE